MSSARTNFLVLLGLAMGVSICWPSFAQIASKNYSNVVVNDEGVLDQQSADRVFKKRAPAQPPGPSYPSRPFFGDTHLHTSQSLDAVMFGNSLGPEEAYRFAEGQEVT